MNSPDAFDDLARHKLEGRAFPFDEGHWQDMQRVLAAEQRRKRRGLYWGLATALLLIGGGLAWMMGGNETPVPVAEMTPDRPTPEVSAPRLNSPSTAPLASTLTGPTSDPATAPPTPTVSVNGPAVKHDAPTKPPTTTSGKTASNAQGTSAAPRARTPQGTTNGSTSPATVSATTAVITVAGAQATPSGGQAPPTSPGDPPILEDGAIAGTDVQPNAVPTDTSTSMLMVPATIAAAAQEPTTTEPATTAQDSTASATAAPTTPPIVPPASPWEITAWGGLMRAHTVYSGSEAPWPGTISDADAPAFGAELMHMGANLGLGTGLHYITYAEHYQQPELTTSVSAIHPVYSVNPIDTSLLVVTGTMMQNGQLYYITQTVDTTLYVLDIGSDTTITSIRLQEAIDRVNHVSYLELPLLVDGHVDAGNWRFGLRGGPTVGLLTGRRGSVPLADPTGSIELSDQPFRECMFGWTLRGYIRYKLCDRWWLGLEPMLRGQLMNAYSTGDLTRRSSGLGIGFSVSYRLP